MSIDALVIGAGPAGLAAAARLARWCKAVTVVESRPRDRRRRAGEHLPPAALRTLTALGLQGLLADGRHGESSGVRSVWGGRDAADRDYFLALPGRGLNLERAIFDEALAAHAEQAGARLLYAAPLTGLARDGAGYVATIGGPEGPRRLTAAIVVDASGRRAVAARRLGGAAMRVDRLVGLIGVIEGAAPVEDPGRLRIEAAEDGWWYGVRLPRGAALAAYLTDPAAIRAHRGGGRGLWADRLAAAGLVGDMARGGVHPRRIEAFDASVQQLAPIAAQGFVAVGDAAAAFDPLSSWGVAKGVGDGHAAAEALERAAAGEPGALAAHDHRRRRDFARHCATRATVYGAETRWHAAPFWRSRRDAAARFTQMGRSGS